MSQPTSDQPTRKEFEDFKREIRQEVQRIERETEPMRLERRLSIPEANTLQKIMDQVGTMTPDVAQLKLDVSKIEKRLDQTATKDDLKAMATKEDLRGMEKRLDAIAGVQKLILDRLPKPPES